MTTKSSAGLSDKLPKLLIVLLEQGGKTENLLLEACYSGERIVLTGKDGCEAALVPVEDLEVLEALET
ncbi:MAG: hypothetical protein HYZ54_14890 [Ignavibacteriae bacterium]|nr:hypothetical protein [Ignavibacteriota bacterium]